MQSEARAWVGGRVCVCEKECFSLSAIQGTFRKQNDIEQ